MMQELEDLFVAECRRQGCQPNSSAMMQMAIDLAGSLVSGDGTIRIVRNGENFSMRANDYVRSLRDSMPTAFENLTEAKAKGLSLTERMRAEVEASRKGLPSDWREVRSRVTGLTASMMDTKEKDFPNI
ncbi:hypothetical protein V1291_001528 [Nitrobacteraceae bacterium AZCC 1564]